MRRERKPGTDHLSSKLVAMRREVSDALTAVEDAVDESRRVLDANELHHMEGDRAELTARVKRFCELSKRYQESD